MKFKGQGKKERPEDLKEETGRKELQKEEFSPGTAGSDIVVISQEEYSGLKEAQEKSKYYFDQLVKLKAEHENAFKQFEKHREEYIRLANFSLLKELLNILEDMERIKGYLDKLPSDFDDIKQAGDMIYKNLKNIFASKGVKSIETLNKPFDPFLHEAVSVVRDADLPDAVVVEEVQKGYTIENKILRIAKVVVNRVEEEEKKEEVKEEVELNENSDEEEKEG